MNRIELEKMARAHLESEGYHVYQAKGIFKVFDMIALSAFTWPRFIKITTKQHQAQKKALVDAKFKKYLYGTFVEVWAWHGGVYHKYFAKYVRKEPGKWERHDFVLRPED